MAIISYQFTQIRHGDRSFQCRRKVQIKENNTIIMITVCICHLVLNECLLALSLSLSLSLTHTHVFATCLGGLGQKNQLYPLYKNTEMLIQFIQFKCRPICIALFTIHINTMSP